MHGGSLRSRRCGKLPHAISDSFEVNEMQRGNVIRRDVATRSAATQSHGRKEIRRVAHCAECRRSVHANTKRRLARRKLTDHFFVLRVHTQRVAEAAEIQNLDALRTTLPPILHHIKRQSRREFFH